MDSLYVDGIAFTVDASTYNDDIAPGVRDYLLRCPVLLTHAVAANVQADSRSEDQEVLLGVGTICANVVHPPLRDEAYDEVAMLPGHLDGCFSIRAGSEAPFGAHLCEEEQTAAKGLPHRGKPADNGGAGNGVRVCDV